MKEKIHEQISLELKQATRLDTIIAITSIAISLILFGAAMGFAYSTTTPAISMSFLDFDTSSSFNTASTIIMFVIVLATVAINWYAVRTLLNNKKQRAKLNKGLVKLYKDEGVNQYYDGSIFKGYETRYNLVAVILGAVGAVSVITPLVVFIDKLVEFF